MNRFIHKPLLDLKAPTKKHLLNLIKWRHENYEGAITVVDVRDTISVENADITIENLIKSGEVIKIKSSRKEILFYIDHMVMIFILIQNLFNHEKKYQSVEGLDDDFLDDHVHSALAKIALPNDKRIEARKSSSK